MRLSIRHLSFGLIFLALSCQSASQVAFNNQQRAMQQLQRQSVGTQRAAEPPMIEIPSPNSNSRPANTRISAIVLHHTAMKQDARTVGDVFTRPSAKVSSHYIVDRTGYIVRSVPDELRSWHAGNSTFQGVGNVNDYSIGIEICNLGDSLEPYSDAQYDGLIQLMAHLVEKYDIPMERITRHRDISIPPGRKIDTSNNFSVQRVIDGIQAIQRGTYRAPLNPAQPNVNALPDSREEVLAGAATLEDIADIYLDNPARWVEVQALNPQFNESSTLAAGTRVQIPHNVDLSKY